MDVWIIRGYLMDIFSSLLGLRSIFGYIFLGNIKRCVLLDARNARLILVDILYEMLNEDK